MQKTVNMSDFVEKRSGKERRVAERRVAERRAACDIKQNDINNLDKITQELKESLVGQPFLELIVNGRSSAGWEEIKTINGRKGFILYVYKDPDCAISMNYGTKGMHWGSHSHFPAADTNRIFESFLVIYGHMILKIGNDKVVNLRMGETATIDAMIKHGADFEEETLFVATTFPPDKDWGDGRKRELD